MAARSSGRPIWRRWNLRTAAAWVWPTAPSSWSEVPSRLAPGTVQIARLTIAAVLSYVVADAFFPGILDLTAPLTALLVVQASTVGTLLMGVVRVGAVLTGVLVAIAVTAYLGLAWWSLALVIAASLLLAKILRLGDQTLEAPISGMLILAVSTPGVAGEVRLANTLIGTVVGIAFSLLVPIAIPNAQAGSAARRVARSQASLLEEISHTLASRQPHSDELTAWAEWGDHIAGELDTAEAALQDAKESRRLNPRALTTATVHPGLSAAVARLGRAHAAEQALVVAIGRQAPDYSGSPADDDPIAAELRRAFAVALDTAASGLRSFGELVEAEYGRVRVDRTDEARARTLEAANEARAVLAELALLDVDTRGQGTLWVLHGSVLAALEHLVAQLDVEQDQRSSEPWLAARTLPTLRSSLLGGWRRER